MTGVKISQLTASSGATLNDTFPMVQSGVTYKETLQQVLTLFSSSLTSTFLPLAGGTMTGPLILNGDASLPLQAVTYQQLQTVAAGFTVILACAAATTANLNATPAGAGVGATLTNAGAMAAFAVDGYSASASDRILVKNQTLTQHNGVYTVTTVGSGAVNWVLTRATDYDSNTEIVPGTLIAVNNGTVNANTSWLETATVAVVDTDPVLFSQFSFGASSFLLKANNLSDLNNVATALVNLGLGTPTGTGNVVLQTSPTLITPILGVAEATSLEFADGTGIIDSTGNELLIFDSVAAAVNYFTLGNDDGTLSGPTLLGSGSGADVGINLWGKGTGSIGLFSNSGSVTLASFAGSTTAVNYLTFSPADAGSAPSIGVDGTDANISLLLSAKGTGGVQVQGTSTNDSAASGFVGEVGTANTSGVSLVDNVAKTVTSVNLSAGDWDITGSMQFTIGGTCSGIAVGVSSTNNTLPSAPLYSVVGMATGTVGSNSALVAPMQRFSLAGATTIYLVGYSNFTTSTVSANGTIYARRVR